MNIFAPHEIPVGRYLVKVRLRTDNPAFPVYMIFLGHVMIGKSFSMVDEGACRWLEQQQREQTFYAYSTERLTDKPYGFTAVHEKYVQKNRKRGAPQKPETIADIEKALAGD